MKRRVVVAGIAGWLCLASATADARPAQCEPVQIGAEQSEAAIRTIAALGASVQYRDEPSGNGKVMVSTDGRWRGGDAGMAHLQRVAGLYKLRLGGDLSDRGLIEVGKICTLTSLDVHVPGITDAGIAHLLPLTRLQRLNLTYTRVSDAGISSLQSMTQLKWMGLSYTGFSRAGMERLKRALPHTIVEGNPTH
jgi:hypothetical protein